MIEYNDRAIFCTALPTLPTIAREEAREKGREKREGNKYEKRERERGTRTLLYKNKRAIKLRRSRQKSCDQIYSLLSLLLTNTPVFYCRSNFALQVNKYTSEN